MVTTLRTLTRHVYYRVASVSRSYRPSEAGPMLELTRPDIVAPLTFPSLFRFWGGTAAGAETRSILQQMGANVLRILHGEEEYEYFGTLHPGDDITGELEIMSIDRKEGSGGAMDMVKTKATYSKQTGEVVAIARATMVVRW